MSAERFFQFSRLYCLEDELSIRLEPWQVEIVKRVFGGVDAEGRRIIHEVLVSTGKKSGKTEFLGLVISFMLLADEARPAICIGLANDREQAGHAFQRVRRSLENSPMLAREVDVQAERILRRDGRGFFKVVSADAPSAGGERPSMLAVDEIGRFTAWELIAENQPGPERAEPLTWLTGFRGPSVLKRAGCPLHDVLERGAAGSDPALLVYDFQGNPSSWCKPEFLEARRRQLPPCEFRRVWLNEWATGEDSFLTPERIAAAIDETLNGGGIARGDEVTVAGLDLGLRHDRSAVAVVGISARGASYHVRLVKLLTWSGSREAEVQISEIEAALIEANEVFRPAAIYCDWWQCAGLIQALQRRALPIMQFNLSPGSLNRLAQGLYGLFADNRIAIPRDPLLTAELSNLVVKQTASGIRWDHVPGLHDDAVMALGLACSPLFEASFRIAGPIPEPEFIEFCAYEGELQ